MKTLRFIFTITILSFMVSACAGSDPAGQSSLEGETWSLTDYNDTSPVDGARPTLQFADGQFSGSTGCNHYGGSYQVKGDSIRFEDLYATEMACQDPVGVMDQERIYLNLLGSADRFVVVDDVLTLFAGSQMILTYEKEKGSTALSTPVPSKPVPTATDIELPTRLPPDDVAEPTRMPTLEPPAGFKEYQDSAVGVSVYIPENWMVTGVIEGQYVIFQSYPEDKYIGGEAREPGDTKCDLNIHPSGTRAAELIQQWKSNSQSRIISEREVILASNRPGTRLEIESMGRSLSLVTEINSRTVVFTCFGESGQVDEIANTLNGFAVTNPPSVRDAEEGFKHYRDTETGTAIDIPAWWIATGIIPGQRVTFQSYPENKYVGGEALQPVDTKCDLFIRNDTNTEEFVYQMKSNNAVTIISINEIVLLSGQIATRIEYDSLGRAITVVADSNANTAILTCFGDFTPVDEIAITLKAGE